MRNPCELAWVAVLVGLGAGCRDSATPSTATVPRTDTFAGAARLAFEALRQDDFARTEALLQREEDIDWLTDTIARPPA
ncbi:MAG: hypothetical protein ACYS6Z_13050, partial [Planctomycetota bacterium]